MRASGRIESLNGTPFFPGMSLTCAKEVQAVGGAGRPVTAFFHTGAGLRRREACAPGRKPAAENKENNL